MPFFTTTRSLSTHRFPPNGLSLSHLNQGFRAKKIDYAAGRDFYPTILISVRKTLLAFLAIPLLTGLTGVAQARSESLLDIQTARRLAKDEAVQRFGPQASKFRYDSRMLRAARIAEERARKHSIKLCWRYVKTALLEADVIESYPKTAYAKQAGDELTRKHGFRRLPIQDPFRAPVGSVLVYGGRGAGHVEIRTNDGFVSDFESATPSKRPLLGVYVKPATQAVAPSARLRNGQPNNTFRVPTRPL